MRVEDSAGRILISSGKDAWKPPVDEMSTRELLGLLDKIRKVGGWYSPFDAHGSLGYGLDEVKAELAKRPHVPTGVEAKKLRRMKAGYHSHGRADKSSR